MSIWITEVVVLMLGLAVLINGWIIPWLGMGFLLLCLAGEVYGAMTNKGIDSNKIGKNVKQKNDKTYT